MNVIKMYQICSKGAEAGLNYNHAGYNTGIFSTVNDPDTAIKCLEIIKTMEDEETDMGHKEVYRNLSKHPVLVRELLISPALCRRLTDEMKELTLTALSGWIRNMENAYSIISNDFNPDDMQYLEQAFDYKNMLQLNGYGYYNSKNYEAIAIYLFYSLLKEGLTDSAESACCILKNTPGIINYFKCDMNPDVFETMKLELSDFAAIKGFRLDDRLSNSVNTEFVKKCATPHFVEVYRLIRKYGSTEMPCNDCRLAEYAETLHSLKSLFFEKMPFFSKKTPEEAENLFSGCTDMLSNYFCGPDAAAELLRRLSRTDASKFEDIFYSTENFLSFCAGKKYSRIADAINGNTYHVSYGGPTQGLYDLFIYAFLNRKNAFLRLAMDEDNMRLIAGMACGGILYDRNFRKVCNINTLSGKDLKKMASRSELEHESENTVSLLKQLAKTGKTYTFNEVDMLVGEPENYAKLYDLIPIQDIDEHMLRVRQLMHPEYKKVIITLNEDERFTLALRLYEKRFSEHTAAYPMINKKNMLRILTLSGENRVLADDMLKHAATNRDAEIFFSNIKNPKYMELGHKQFINDFITFDEDSLKLFAETGITGEQIEENRKTVTDFCLSGGATVALSYLNGLNDAARSKNLRLIALAAMMGRLDDIKFADLSREVGFTVSDNMQEAWKKNKEIKYGTFQVKEYTDFMHSMKIGTLTGRTCMDYSNGAYKRCLLSTFDGNKKVLYATKEGEYLGRAILRLTKYSYKDNETQLRFRDINDLIEDGSSTEQPVLFLEKLYQHDAGEKEIVTIRNGILRLAEEKAREMGLPLVVADSYALRQDDSCKYTGKDGYMYVSKSKNGMQYLDSLGGACEKGGYYKYGKFYFVESYVK